MFVKNYPALKLGKALVIADVHLGITYELWKDGISLPKQSEIFAERVKRLTKITRTKELIIIGDVKHKVPGMSKEEIREIPMFFSLLPDVDVTIIPGNHDGILKKILPKEVKVVSSEGLLKGSYLLTHGHRNIAKRFRGAKTIVIGHNHPFVKFRDELGVLFFEPVWVRGKIKTDYGEKNLIIMPAFNELSGASIVNDPDYEPIGPIAKRLENAHAYLLDGTDLGELKRIVIV